MSNSRYALRSAAYIVVFLAVFWASTATPFAPLPTLVVAAAWLTAQAVHGRRRLDLIMLTTTATVAATLEGAGLLLSATVAISEVLPALLFAVLLERWLPGYRRGHGDRFRSPRTALSRLAAAAVLAAATGLALDGVIDTAGLGPGMLAFEMVRDSVTLLLLPLVVRAFHRSRTPRRAALSVVR